MITIQPRSYWNRIRAKLLDDPAYTFYGIWPIVTLQSNIKRSHEKINQVFLLVMRCDAMLLGFWIFLQRLRLAGRLDWSLSWRWAFITMQNTWAQFGSCNEPTLWTCKGHDFYQIKSKVYNIFQEQGWRRSDSQVVGHFCFPR